MPTALLSPEAKLLLLAAGGPEGDGEVRALLDGGLDWDRVVALTVRERAHAALWRRVSAAGADAVPPEVREGLRRLGMVAAFRQGRLEGCLAGALDVLAEADVPVLLLKGAALAAGVYGSFAERPMADLDLLVPADRAEEAQRRLLAAGWTHAADLPAERRAEIYADHHHLAPLMDTAGAGVVLEVHASPLPQGHPFAFSVDDLWREARPVAVQGRAALAPSPRHHLLHLCLHFAWAHALRSGAWRSLRDARTLAERAPPEWDDFVELARGARAGSCVYWTLRLARSLVRAPVPDSVLAALRPRAPEAALLRLERHFAAGALGGAACPSPWLVRRLWEVAVRPGPSGHGEARPWARDRRFADSGLGDDSAAPSWRDAAGWMGWLATVVLS